jgi:predicted transcriptional regulator
MEVTIDTYIYDKLKEYSRRLDEPMSVIATKAIKKYVDVGD